MSWTIVVRTPTADTIRKIYGPKSQTGQLETGKNVHSAELVTDAYVESFFATTTPEGICQDATITAGAVGSVLDIRALDVVEIQTLGELAGEDAAKYYRRYTGLALEPANTQTATGVARQYRLIGLGEDLHYADSGQNYRIEADIELGAAANRILQNATLPETLLNIGVGFVGPISNLIHTSAAINPSSLSVLDNFEALAKFGLQENRKIVFGVNAHRNPVFVAKLTTATTVDERTVKTSAGFVERRETQAAAQVSRVRLLIGAADANGYLFGTSVWNDTDSDVLTYGPVADSTAYATRTLTLRPPDNKDFMLPFALTPTVTSGILHKSFIDGAEDGVPTLSRVMDGNTSSFAVIKSNTSLGTVTLRYTLPSGTKAEDIVRATVSLKTQGGDGTADVVAHRVTLRGSGLGLNLSSNGDYYAKGAPSVDVKRVLGDRQRRKGETVNALTVDLTVSLLPSNLAHYVAVEDFRLWTLDGVALEAVAKAEFREPKPQNFSIIRPGIQAPAGLVTLYEEAGTTVFGGEVETMSYELGRHPDPLTGAQQRARLYTWHNVGSFRDADEIDQANLERRRTITSENRRL